MLKKILLWILSVLAIGWVIINGKKGGSNGLTEKAKEDSKNAYAHIEKQGILADIRNANNDLAKFRRSRL